MQPDGSNPYEQNYAPPPAGGPGANPYAAPKQDNWADTYLDQEEVPQGTYWGGFAVGFFFALLGLIIVYIVGKDETKRGSLHGFGARLGLTVFIFLISMVLAS
ncbi:MAG: hypothetical protein KC457_20645 [Myxococcales bacterium]|nr:hypothetical protein [Myxococcales bacterium]